MPFGRAFLHADAGHHDEQTRRSQNRHQAVTARGRDSATGPMHGSQPYIHTSAPYEEMRAHAADRAATHATIRRCCEA
jgi:hypothetical protein